MIKKVIRSPTALFAALYPRIDISHTYSDILLDSRQQMVGLVLGRSVNSLKENSRLSYNIYEL